MVRRLLAPPQIKSSPLRRSTVPIGVFWVAVPGGALVV
jgi:hypothetical protein